MTGSQRVVVYIDGYNLYYGLRDAYSGRYKWLDLQSFSEKAVAAEHDT